MNNLLKQVEEFAREEFSKKEWELFAYHDLEHTINVVQEIKILVDSNPLPADTTHALLIAAWLHDLGYVEDPKNHENGSIRIAKRFLESHNTEPAVAKEIIDLIDSTRVGYDNNDTLSKKILHDADLSNAGKKGFKEKGNLLRKEWATQSDQDFDDEEWQSLQKEYLSKLEYLSPMGIKRYKKRKNKNLKKFLINTKENKMATRKLGRGIETLYRTTYRNHINFSAIADNKANMMIGINAIILSIVLTLFGSGLGGSVEEFIGNPLTILPVGILVLCSSIAMVFSVLSARPNVSKNKIHFDPENPAATNGILFFGNFTGLSQSQFNQYMTLLQESDDLTYENMNNDLYNLGLVLLKKYSLLRKAYNIFMFGLILSITIFILIMIVSRFL